MKSKLLIISILLLSSINFCIFYIYSKKEIEKSVGNNSIVKYVVPIEPIIEREILYHLITLETLKPQEELKKLVGDKNFDNVLILNRIDKQNIKNGSILVIPDNFEHYSFNVFPSQISSMVLIPKIILVSKKVQAFGLYEYGNLIRQGSVSTGKKSTPTKSDLYFTNWKGKKVISTFSDEWVLEWSFNIDNFGGISIHKYELPGYPASHSCVRLLENDAKFIYDWAEQWTLSQDQEQVLGRGTPVIIFGEYEYNKTAPWKNLPNNNKSTNLSDNEIQKVIDVYIKDINQALEDRINLINIQ